MSNFDPLDIYDHEAAEEAKRDKERVVAKSEEEDFKWLMSSKRGRRIIWRLLSQAGVFQPVFHPTAMVMSFREGKRNYGLQTLTAVNTYCPDLYSAMVKENTNGITVGNRQPTQ